MKYSVTKCFLKYFLKIIYTYICLIKRSAISDVYIFLIYYYVYICDHDTYRISNVFIYLNRYEIYVHSNYSTHH